MGELRDLDAAREARDVRRALQHVHPGTAVADDEDYDRVMRALGKEIERAQRRHPAGRVIRQEGDVEGITRDTIVHGDVYIERVRRG